MKTIIQIEDDFDLEKIAFCGQCFRAEKLADSTFRFITGKEILYIKKNDAGYAISCDEGSWNAIWHPYFDLSRNYRQIRENMSHKHDFAMKAAECGCGLRILRQNTWEMLLTFIISQRRSIPAIRTAVEKLSEKFGEAVETDYESLFFFPTPARLAAASEEEIAACGLGYRTAYVAEAAKRVASGEMDLELWEAYGDEELFQALMGIRGVGKKVANCVCLFGYGRMARVPVDVWISRAIDMEFHGEDPFGDYGGYAGLMQQYIFYYERYGSGYRPQQ